MRRRWPDLAYRVRREEKKTDWPGKDKDDWPGKAQGWSRPEELKFGDIFVTLLNKVVEESVGTDREMTEESYIAHLKDCATCRRNVASFARMGVKIPSRILVAAGVEVLN